MNPLRKQTFREYAHRFQIEEELQGREIQRFSTRTLRNSLRARAFPTLLCPCGCHTPFDGAPVSKWSQLGNGAGSIRIGNEATATFALVGTSSRVACTKVGIYSPPLPSKVMPIPNLRLPRKNRLNSTKEREFTVKSYRFVS